MGQDELNEKVLEEDQHRPVLSTTSPEPSIHPVPSVSRPEVTNNIDQHEVTPDDRPDQASERVDPENLTRQPSGPAYSVFSPSTKRWITLMATVACFASPMSANIYYPVLAPIADDLGVSIALVNLTVTSYMILQAISPTIFGDFGDMAGRRPAFLVAFSIYLVACVGLALQRNYAALLILRMLQSAGSSGAIALGFAMVADISMSSERGKYMGIVGAGINVGPTIGPVLGGVLTQYYGWASIFWFCVVLVGLWIVPYAFFIPETCRNVVGNGSLPPQPWNRPVVDLIRRRQSNALSRSTSTTTDAQPKRKLQFPNPIRSVKIIFEKEMGLVLAYNSLLYVAFICVAATLGTLFREIYGFNDLELGLCYLPYGAGCVIASLGQGYVLDWNYRRLARKIGFTIDRRRGDDLSKFPIEKARLQPVYPAIAIGLVALVAYGWVLQTETSVAVPLVLQGVIGLTITGSFSIMNTLIVDLFPDAPATATAANNLIRCTLGAVGTAVIDYMISGMGRGWSFTFLAALCAVPSPMMFLIAKKGPKWRNERRKRGDAS
ncbi:major facilitator superfamily transporter [Colletotrichum sublineola]|uniref:Putative major facilitator superfamily transporter n=1 Tax=Colletotrichum sublineola TaxID=1173701 RepID=A0A066XNX6_COLSU|nr:major facilitator superfamily transporter [Colletotrichum sublineola]KDN67685.1 putative major facilitator superfamily transporter [Colletotrichum sublineola]